MEDKKRIEDLEQRLAKLEQLVDDLIERLSNRSTASGNFAILND